MADNLKPKAVGAESADSLNPRNEEVPMADNKPRMKAVPESAPAPETAPETPALEPEVGANPATAPQASPEQLDEDEKEFRSMRRDLPGAQGASAVGIVTIGVAKVPGKNEFFRTHPDFRPIVPVVDIDVDMDKHFFAVTDEMVKALASIGVTVSLHTLYLTVTARGATKIVPVRQANEDGEQNEYARTKEIGLVRGTKEWVRLYTDTKNRVYEVYPAPAGRFADPIWPVLSHAKIFRLAFRDKGRLIDSHQHPTFQKWTARD